MVKSPLTLGEKEEAEIILKPIVDNYGFILLLKYSDLWSDVNENNSKSIFEVRHISSSYRKGSSFTNGFSSRGSLQTILSFGRNRPTASLENSFEIGDERIELSMGTFCIDEIGNPVINKFSGTPAL